jgi:hypothetical protein
MYEYQDHPLENQPDPLKDIPSYDDIPQAQPDRRLWPAAAVALVVLVALFSYALHQRSVAAHATAQNAKLAASLNDIHTQMDSLATKLTAMTEAEQRAQQAAVAARQTTRQVVTQRRRVDDTRWTKVQAALDEHSKAIGAARQDLDTTRQELASTGTELRGSIATTHEELVTLQRKGERNYFEFDIEKSKRFQLAGPVGISLRKANTKHSYADLELMIEDAQVSQKHVNLYQPVMFYAADTGQPMELVINNVGKNHIHGYISAPKYRNTELAAMSARPGSGSSTAANADAANAPAQQGAAAVNPPPLRSRQKLPQPIR